MCVNSMATLVHDLRVTLSVDSTQMVLARIRDPATYLRSFVFERELAIFGGVKSDEDLSHM